MSDLLRFHVFVYARPAIARAGSPLTISGNTVTPIVCDSAALLSAWKLTFDAASAALAKLPRMFLEPDGSFVWVGGEGEGEWQVDGMLYDRGDRLAYAELKGNCRPVALKSLLEALSDRSQPLIFQFVSGGLLVEAADLVRLASGD